MRNDFWTQAQIIRRRLEEPMDCACDSALNSRAPMDLITRSPIAAYRFKTGWELLDENDYYPEEYLASLQRCGINGIWVAGLFRTLIASRVLPELGPDRHRLEKLKALAEKAGRYGIRVWFFCMEPRSVRADHPVLAAHPEIRGAKVDEGEYCLCTSALPVQEYLRQAVCTLLTEVPDLGGIITIFNGERITNCWLSEEYARTCPRCSRRPQADVLAEDLGCYAEGIRRAGSTARCLAWTYWMDPDDELKTHSVAPVLELIDKTDRQVVWLANFEHGGKKMIGGREVSIDEYSLSYTGPSEPFEQVARACARHGRQAAAKLQVGTAFELSPVPYVPVPGIIFDKFAKIKELGVGDIMLNWIPGGFPSLMLMAAGCAARVPGTKKQFLQQLAGLFWPVKCVDRVVQAWTSFETGFQNYPFNNRFFYFGPIFRAPAYPLRLEKNPNHALPLNWGINRLRQPQPFEEDVARWLGPFTEQEILDQLMRMILDWDAGLAHLSAAARDHPAEESRRQLAVASAVTGHFRCTKNVFEFLSYRNRLAEAAAVEREEIIRRLKVIVRSQIDLAGRFKEWIRIEPAIGYQSEILDYCYDASLLDKSIAVNQKTLKTLDGSYSDILAALKETLPRITQDTSIPNLDLYGD